MDEELRELLTLFTPIKRFSDRFERGTVDLARPKTEIARFTKALHGASEQMDGDRIAEHLVRLLGRLPPFDVKEVFATRPRPEGALVQLLCDYLDEVDRHVPMLTSIVHGGSFLPTLGFLENWRTAEARLRPAATTRGEMRAQRLRALADFLEVVYRELVTVLYEIECVREPRQIHRGLDFGNLVETVGAWTCDSLPGFVDRDAARIRNAAAHYHWRYDPATDLLHLHNRSKQGKVTWEDNFQLPELYRRLRDMYLAVGHMETALLWRTSTAFFEMSASHRYLASSNRDCSPLLPPSLRSRIKRQSRRASRCSKSISLPRAGPRGAASTTLQSAPRTSSPPPATPPRQSRVPQNMATRRPPHA